MGNEIHGGHFIVLEEISRIWAFRVNFFGAGKKKSEFKILLIYMTNMIPGRGDEVMNCILMF